MKSIRSPIVKAPTRAPTVGAEKVMPKTRHGDDVSEKQGAADGIMESGRKKTLLKTGALQSAIFNSANFSSIATDAKGVIWYRKRNKSRTSSTSHRHTLVSLRRLSYYGRGVI